MNELYCNTCARKHETAEYSGDVNRNIRVAFWRGLGMQQERDMTRINGGVHPSELPRTALIAEHREITRVPNAVRRNPNVNTAALPESFRFGEGHVRFFYNKLCYLRDRYISLYDECVLRGYNVTDKTSAFDGLPGHVMGCWIPGEADRQLTLARLKERGHELIVQNTAIHEVSHNESDQ